MTRLKNPNTHSPSHKKHLPPALLSPPPLLSAPRRTANLNRTRLHFAAPLLCRCHPQLLRPHRRNPSLSSNSICRSLSQALKFSQSVDLSLKFSRNQQKKRKGIEEKFYEEDSEITERKRIKENRNYNDIILFFLKSLKKGKYDPAMPSSFSGSNLVYEYMNPGESLSRGQALNSTLPDRPDQPESSRPKEKATVGQKHG
ncbi:hypothetical protein OROGR_021144 [Orobanche gracilis]